MAPRCHREQEPKVDGVEERVPVGAYRSTSTAAKAKQERIVLERDSGPRLEARKEEKGKRKVAQVTPEFAGAVGKPAQCGKLHQWELEHESERCGRRQKVTSVKKYMKMTMSYMRSVCWRRARMSNGRKSSARNLN